GFGCYLFFLFRLVIAVLPEEMSAESRVLQSAADSRVSQAGVSCVTSEPTLSRALQAAFTACPSCGDAVSLASLDSPVPAPAPSPHPDSVDPRLLRAPGALGPWVFLACLLSLPPRVLGFDLPC
ncbi:hypothetical protein H1C71_018872, partial [Ictidomys tridecemlineatus]